LVVSLALFLCDGSAFAEQDASKAAKIEAELKAAFREAEIVQKTGPVTVSLGEQGQLALPKGFVYVPQPEAGRLVRAHGGNADQHLMGVILPKGTGRYWVAKLEFANSGYVKDEEAKNWNASELLKTFQEKTDAANEDRIERGFQAIEVTGWVEPPTYDATAHRLVWAALVRIKGDANDQGSINYNTYALGRDGYFSLDLVTAADAIAVDKANARELLAGIHFASGKAYADFNAATDHVAEFGIAALVGGLAAKKLGLLAIAGAFLVKAWKLVLIGLAAAGAAGLGLLAFFTRKKPPEAQV
jgi:uncharacterized membrane-anchored protein